MHRVQVLSDMKDAANEKASPSLGLASLVKGTSTATTVPGTADEFAALGRKAGVLGSKKKR